METIPKMLIFPINTFLEGAHLDATELIEVFNGVYSYAVLLKQLPQQLI